MLALPRAARRVGRAAAGARRDPDSTRPGTVGLVTLPRVFGGMLRGGNSPVQAGAVQLFVRVALVARVVPVALMAVRAAAAANVLELVARGWPHRDGAGVSATGR